MGIDGVMAPATNERVHSPAEVELCFCDSPAFETCGCCQLARCPEHLSLGLCARCTKAVNRAYVAAANTRWAIGTITIVIAVVEGVLAASKLYVLSALPLGILAAWSVGRLQHAHLVRTLGVRMSENTGELSAPQGSVAAFSDYGAEEPFADAYDGPYGYDGGHEAGGHDGGGDDH